MRVRLLPLLAAALALTLASPASAYVIYLKDGSQVTAREKPTVQGKYLVFYTPLGAMQRVPVAEYDEKKSNEMNSQGTGDAYVLGSTPEEKAPDGAKPPSLSNYIQQHKKSGIGEERQPVEVAKETKGPRAVEGSSSALQPELENGFIHTLESYGVKAPRITAAPVGVRVQGITDTEEQVLAALKGIAKAVSDTRTTSHAVTKADIYLSTATGENAGHFEMTAEDADVLVSGRKTPIAWFMANVTL